MLRSDWVTIETLLRAARPSLSQMPRGQVTMDSADLVSNVADGKHLPNMLGLKLVRDAALGNGKYVYTDSAGTSIATNV